MHGSWLNPHQKAHIFGILITGGAVKEGHRKKRKIISFQKELRDLAPNQQIFDANLEES